MLWVPAAKCCYFQSFKELTRLKSLTVSVFPVFIHLRIELAHRCLMSVIWREPMKLYIFTHNEKYIYRGNTQSAALLMNFTLNKKHL